MAAGADYNSAIDALIAQRGGAPVGNSPAAATPDSDANVGEAPAGGAGAAYNAGIDSLLAQRGVLPDAPSSGPKNDWKYWAQSAIKSLVGTGSRMIDPESAWVWQQAQNLAPEGSPRIDITDPRTHEAAANAASDFVVGGSNYQPETELGQKIGAGINGAIGALPFAPFAPIAMPVSGFLGGVGGDFGRDIAKSRGYGPIGQTVGDLAGNFIGGGLGLGGLSRIGRAPSAAVASLDEMGIPTNKGIERGLALQNQFENTPMGAYQRAAGDVGTSIGDTATPTQIGQRLMTKGQAWLDDQQARASAAFNDFEKNTMPKGTPIETTATQDLLTTPSDMKAPPIFREVGDIVEKYNGNIPYETAKALRTKVGAATEFDTMQNGGQYNPQLKKLYGTLTDDMETGISKVGGQDAVDKFRSMNKAFGESQGFIEDRMGKLANSSVTPESVYTSLASNPAKTATWLGDLKARGVIDQTDLDLIARSQFEKMARNADGIYDPTTFSKNVTKLRQASPEAEKLLFGNGATADEYTNLVNNSRMLDQAVNGGMARANQEGGTMGKLLMNAAKTGAGIVGGGQVAGHVGEIAGAALGMGGHAAATEAGNALYQLAKKPWFSGMISKLVTSPAAGSKVLLNMARMYPESAGELTTLANGLSAPEQK